jgi:AbrB family looped-hinge helix DNA binding protein
MKATITSKGQITIPVRVRKRLNLKPGDVLDFDDAAPYLLARPDFSENEMRAALGCAMEKIGASTGQWLEQTRGGVQNPPAQPA